MTQASLKPHDTQALDALTGGAFTDTSGNVRFGGDGSMDGLTGPTFADGKNLRDNRGYYVLSIGCGGHFDLFGK